MEAVDSIELAGMGVFSLVLRDLSEYATLPFLAAFDVQTPLSTAASKVSRTGPHRVTYIALSKKTMPMLVDLFLRFKDEAAIFIDGTVEALFAVSFRNARFLHSDSEVPLYRPILSLSSSSTIVPRPRNSGKTSPFGRRQRRAFCAL